MVTIPLLEALRCNELIDAPRRRVVLLADATSDFDMIEERKQARLVRIMELWCDSQRLTEEQFNGNEGREQKGSTNVLMQAFKTHKVRLYGVDVQIGGKRTFAILEIDAAKKQNKADPKVLKRAMLRAFDLFSALGEAEGGSTTTGTKK